MPFCEMYVTGLQCGVVALTIHKGGDGALVVSIGKEDQLFVDKFGKGHMVDPLTIQEGLGKTGATYKRSNKCETALLTNPSNFSHEPPSTHSTTHLIRSLLSLLPPPAQPVGQPHLARVRLVLCKCLFSGTDTQHNMELVWLMEAW